MINFDFPASVVDYMHRAGRTGRLGMTMMSSSQVTSFLSHNRELVIMEQIKVESFTVKGSTEKEGTKQQSTCLYGSTLMTFS